MHVNALQAAIRPLIALCDWLAGVVLQAIGSATREPDAFQILPDVLARGRLASLGARR